MYSAVFFSSNFFSLLSAMRTEPFEMYSKMMSTPVKENRRGEVRREALRTLLAHSLTCFII